MTRQAADISEDEALQRLFASPPLYRRGKVKSQPKLVKGSLIDRRQACGHWNAALPPISPQPMAAPAMAGGIATRRPFFLSPSVERVANAPRKIWCQSSSDGTSASRNFTKPNVEGVACSCHNSVV
jgi:hypothetical protein